MKNDELIFYFLFVRYAAERKEGLRDMFIRYVVIKVEVLSGGFI